MALKAPNIQLNLPSDTCNSEENAKACAQRLLLKQPNSDTFFSLKQWLSSSSTPWLREFIRCQGLDRLIETLTLLSQDRQTEEWSSISDAILQLDCMGCIREVLSHREGMEHLLENQRLIEKLVLALDTPNTYPKKQMFEVLSCITMVTTEGHTHVLKALDNYKRVKHQAHRFTLVLHELKLADNAHYRHTLMTFVNALIGCVQDLHGRCRVRNQFIGLKLLDVLNFLKKDELDPQLCVQIKTFHEMKSKDEVELANLHSFQFNDATALFEAINNKTDGSVESSSFLHILQNLYTLGTDCKIPHKLWNTLETITNQIVNLQKECEADTFIQDLNDFLTQPSQRLDKNPAIAKETYYDMDIKQDLANRYKLTADWSMDDSQKFGTEGTELGTKDSELGPKTITSQIPATEGESDTLSTETVTNHEQVHNTEEFNKFSEVDEALKAILRTTESLRLENKDLEEKDDRRDSGISMRSSVSSPLYSRQHSNDRGNEVRVTGRSSTGSANVLARFGKLPSIDESDKAGGDSVFEKAAKVQRSSRVDLMKCGGGKDEEEPVKLVKTKFATIVPVAVNKSKDRSTLFDRQYTDAKKSFRLDHHALENDFKFDLQKKLQDPEYEVQLLGNETTLALNVLLARLETTAEYLAACIRHGDMDDLDIQATRRLLRALPSQQQVDQVVAYTAHGNMYDLGQAEQLMVHLASIPDYRLKLKASVFRADFKKKFFELQKAFDCMVTACRDVMHSGRLQRFMGTVVEAANFLNRGSHVPKMHGACLDTWCTLEDTVDNEGTSLLRHVVKQMHVKDRNLLGFYEDFGTLEKAASCNVESLKQEVCDLNIQLKKFIDTLQNGQISTRKSYEPMLAIIKGDLQHLQEQISSLKTLSHQLADYLCVSSDEFDLQECFGHLLKFSTLVKTHCKTEEQQRHIRRLADSKLQALGANNAEQYFKNLFACNDKPEESSKVKRLNLIDIILEHLHQGKIQPNFLGNPTEVDPKRDQINEQVDNENKGENEHDENQINNKDPDVNPDGKRSLNISEMFDFLEENMASPPIKGHGLSNCTYHVASPRAVTLSLTKPFTTSCLPAQKDAQKDNSGVYDEKIVAIDTTGAFDVGEREDKEEPALMENKPVLSKVEPVLPADKPQPDYQKEAQFKVPLPLKDTGNAKYGGNCGELKFPVEKFTPDKELSWDGFLPMQYTPGKDIYLPIQSTPAKDGESILVIPDLRPDGKRTFADKADLFILGQYRKTHQISSASFVAPENPPAERKPPNKNRTGTNPNILKVLDIAEDKSIELDAKAYDRTEATPYDNVKAPGQKEEKVKTRPERPPLFGADGKGGACEAKKETGDRRSSEVENKENSEPATKKPKAKPASKLGILKRFSKVVLRQKEPSTDKTETETKASNNHKNPGPNANNHKVSTGLVRHGTAYQHKNTAAVMRGEKLMVDPAKNKSKTAVSESSKENNYQTQPAETADVKATVAEQGVVTINLYTTESNPAGATNISKPSGESTKSGTDSADDTLKKPPIKPFQRQNALPVRTKLGQHNPANLKTVGPRSTLPHTKKEEKVRLGGYKDKDIVIKPSYNKIVSENQIDKMVSENQTNKMVSENQPTRPPRRPRSLQFGSNILRPSQQNNIQNNVNNVKSTKSTLESNTRKSIAAPKYGTTGRIPTKSTDENKTGIQGTKTVDYQKSKPKVPAGQKDTENKRTNIKAPSRFGFIKPQGDKPVSGEIESARACSLKIYKKY